MGVEFQALTWETVDTDDEHLVSIFGKTEGGKSICVTTAFTPYFFIKLPERVTQQTIQEIYMVLDKKCPECLVSYSIMKSKAMKLVVVCIPCIAIILLLVWIIETLK